MYRYLIAEAMEFAKIVEVHMAFQNPDERVLFLSSLFLSIPKASILKHFFSF